MQLLQKLYIALLLLSLGSALSSCHNDKEEEQLPPRTLLLIAMADNNLYRYSEKDLELITSSATAVNLNKGNLLFYLTGKGSAADTLYLIKEQTKEAIATFEGLKLTKPADMRHVIDEVTRLFPAKQYGLILSSHGTSWLPADYNSRLRSFGMDGNDWMELPELAEALPDHLFDFILMDACYMSSIECAYELRNKTDYLIASPTEILVNAWPYGQLLPEMFATNASVEQICRLSFDSIQSSSTPYEALSLIRTETIEDLRSVVQEILSDKSEEDLYEVREGDIERMEYLTRSDEKGMLYDFDQFISLLATPEQYARFQACLRDLLPYEAHTPSVYFATLASAIQINHCCGLSVYIPKASQPRLFDWYRNHVSWYKAVYPQQ